MSFPIQATRNRPERIGMLDLSSASSVELVPDCEFPIKATRNRPERIGMHDLSSASSVELVPDSEFPDPGCP